MNIRLWFFLPFFLFVSCQTPLKSKKWVAKGDLYLKRDLYREAVEYYQKALEHDPYSQDAHFRLGVVLIKVGNYTAALSHLQKAKRSYKGSYEFHFSLGEIYRIFEKHDEAIFQYQTALKSREKVEAKRALAWTYYKIRFYKGALSLAKQAYQSNTQDAQSAIVYIRTLIKLKNLKRAYKVINRVNWRAKFKPYVHGLKGEIFYILDRIPEARAQYSKALSLQPMLASALFGLAKIYLLKNKNNLKAIKLLERGLRIRPGEASAYLDLARAYNGIDTKMALKYYRRFLKTAKLDPEFSKEIQAVKKRLAKASK